MRSHPPLWFTLVLAAAGASVIATAQSRDIDVLTATVADIQAEVQSGALTYERLVQQYLARIGASAVVVVRHDAVC